MFADAKLTTILCSLSLRPTFSFVLIIPHFAFVINLVSCLFTFYTSFCVLRRKNPCHSRQRLFSTQPHGLRHFLLYSRVGCVLGRFVVVRDLDVSILCFQSYVATLTASIFPIFPRQTCFNLMQSYRLHQQ